VKSENVMSGDLEDFLKRAAERRQSRQAKTPPQPQQRPAARPEYTDARRERTVRPPAGDDDEIVVAQVIEEPLAKRIAELQRKQAEAQSARHANREGSASRREAHPVESAMAENDRKRVARRDAGRAESAAMSRPRSDAPASKAAALGESASAAEHFDADSLIDELVASLKSPQGLRKAMLMREILDRPEHRW